jgi:prepilin-type N-terminal cleavage/methylation domain-containing protein
MKRMKERPKYGRSTMGGLRASRAGFTLVEILIAAVILGILLIGIGFFFANMITQSDVMDDRTRALELCQQGLENLRTQNVSSLPDGQASEDSVEIYHREVLLDTPYSEYPNARLVTCRVDWTGPNGVDSVSLSTIY